MLKVRDLSITKRYRDSVKKWGPPDFPRKRIIIAPLMSTAAAKDSNIHPPSGSKTTTNRFTEDIERLFNLMKLGETTDIGSKNDQSKFADEYAKYRAWIEKEKILRKDLNNLGLNSDWLLKKLDRTALEERVLKRLLPAAENTEKDVKETKETEVHETPTPPPLSKAQMRLLPLLQQPIPVALSIIAEHCYKNKLRLIDLYTQMDKDKDWQISREEFRKIITDNKIPLKQEQLEDLIIALDSNNNDQLDYKELAQGVEAYKIDDRWQKIRELMKILESRADKELVKNNPKKEIVHKRHSSRGRRSSTRASVRFKEDDTDSLSEFSDSSLDLLQLPKVNTSKLTDSSAIKTRERRMKKHREKKDQQRMRRQKQAKTKGYLPSTIEGKTGQLKDKYAEQTVNHVNESLDMMHTKGIPIKEDALKRVLLFPFDKSIHMCKTSLRQPGVNLAQGEAFDKRKRYSNMIYQEEKQAARGKRKDGKHSSRRHGKTNAAWKTRRQTVNWGISESPALSIEDIGRKTPTESLFQLVRTPSLL